MADEQKPGGESAQTPSPPGVQPAAPAGHAAPKPPVTMATVVWESELTRSLQQRFGNQISEFSAYLGQHFLVARPEAVIPILEFLKSEADFDYLVDITAVDYPQRPERFDIIYILYSFPRNERIRVKARIADGYKPATAVGVHLTANWLEREVFDMFGIEFAGHPDMRRILLPEELGRSPAPQRPLHHRRRQPMGEGKPRDRERTVTMPEATFLDSTELVLNMGPQHPSTHGVLRVILKLDGEKVIGTECVIGYLHRGVEKIGENRTYQQFAPYVDRMDYLASVSNGLGYCLAVEKLLSIEAPPRAQVIRVILTELNRIASHLFWLGTHALDIGAITPLFYVMREREEILKIYENYCGARLTTHAFRIGGLQYELYDGFEQEVKACCEMLLPKIDEYEELLTGNRIWVGRLKGIGILNAGECKQYGVTGPMLRAAGVKWDLRRAQPYSGYEQYDFMIPTGQNGDTYDRYLVRMEEMRQSVRIVRQAVEKIPSGPIMAKVPKVIKPPTGEVYVSIEAPKGELGYLIVSDGSTHPYRVRVRPPSFINLQALDRMARGALVADLVAIIGTIDIVLGEVDR